MNSIKDNQVFCEGGVPADGEIAKNSVNPAPVSEEAGGNHIYMVKEDHDKFGSKFEYILSCIGFAVGFGNVWRFPYMCYTLGGAAFLIPYFFSFFLIAVPLFLIETSYGQLIDMPLYWRWGAVVPRMWGLKIVQVSICFFTTIYYITLMAWSWAYFFRSFSSPLPWAKEEIKVEAGVELTQAQKNLAFKNLWNEDFLYKETMDRSDSIQTQGGLVGNLVGCLVLSYVVTYFCCWKGLKSTGKMVYVTCLLPYVILTIFLIKGLTLKGCGQGLYYLFVPDGSKIGLASTWKASATQILFSSGVAYGPFLYYGSARPRNDKLVFPSLWIPFCNSATSIYAAITLFTFLGHVADAKGIEVSEVATSGPTLLFVAFPALLNMLSGANFFAVTFFLMCVMLGIDSVFGFVDYYIKMAEDVFPNLKEKMRKEVQVLCVIAFSFIWSLMFVSQGGYYNFIMFDDYCASIQLLFCLFCQTIFIPWIWGIDRLSVLINIQTGQYIPKFYIFIIRIFVPVFGFIMLHFSYTGEFSESNVANRMSAKGGSWTMGHIWGARLIMFFPMLIMVIVMMFPLNEETHKSIDEMVEQQYGIRFEKEPELKWHEWLFKQDAKYTITNQAQFDQVLNDKAAAEAGEPPKSVDPSSVKPVDATEVK